jgi:hypothetical protein
VPLLPDERTNQCAASPKPEPCWRPRDADDEVKRRQITDPAELRDLQILLGEGLALLFEKERTKCCSVRNRNQSQRRSSSAMPLTKFWQKQRTLASATPRFQGASPMNSDCGRQRTGGTVACCVVSTQLFLDGIGEQATQHGCRQVCHAWSLLSDFFDDADRHPARHVAHKAVTIQDGEDRS